MESQLFINKTIKQSGQKKREDKTAFFTKKKMTVEEMLKILLHMNILKHVCNLWISLYLLAVLKYIAKQQSKKLQINSLGNCFIEVECLCWVLFVIYFACRERLPFETQKLS